MPRTQKEYVFLLLIFSFLISCKQAPLLFIPHDNSNLTYMGRIGRTDSVAVIYWSGSSVSMNFEGTEVRALMQDEKGNNYFNVIIDSTSPVVFKPGPKKKFYTLASHLKPGRHSIQLFKRTEGTNGKTWFYGFALQQGDSILAPGLPAKKKMEFYGNSITSGYAIEDNWRESRDAIYLNNYLSYAAITARHYNAAYHCISKSGIGLMVGWCRVIMPEMYDRTDPEDSNSKWDFSKYTPDIVVINLFQNDCSIIRQPDLPEFKRRFGSAAPDRAYIVSTYKNFIKIIRSKYPAAAIVCVLGDMDATQEGSPWPGYITEAVSQLKDPNIYTHFFPYRNARGHPKAKEHAAMAESLIKFIDSHVQW